MQYSVASVFKRLRMKLNAYSVCNPAFLLIFLQTFAKAIKSGMADAAGLNYPP